MKNIRMFYLQNVLFFGGKISVYMNRRVFVMSKSIQVCCTALCYMYLNNSFDHKHP